MKHFRSVFGLARFIATDKQVQAAIKAERVQLITRSDHKSILRRAVGRVASVVSLLRKGTFS